METVRKYCDVSRPTLALKPSTVTTTNRPAAANALRPDCLLMTPASLLCIARMQRLDRGAHTPGEKPDIPGALRAQLTAGPRNLVVERP